MLVASSKREFSLKVHWQHWTCLESIHLYVFICVSVYIYLPIFVKLNQNSSIKYLKYFSTSKPLDGTWNLPPETFLPHDNFQLGYLE